MTQRELIGIAYSPWTEKARWALDHHGIEYRYSEHTILLGMPALRIKMRSLFGELTVPSFIDGAHRLGDSYDIAKHADAIGVAEKLFGSHESRIDHFNALSERALDAGRALTMARVARDKAAQRDNVPRFVPKFMRGTMGPLVQLGLIYLDREFQVTAKALDQREADFVEVLSLVRDELSRSGGDYLLGRFSYADIAMASVLHFVAPLGEPYFQLGEAQRQSMTSEKLGREFADLVAWRDRLYERHRKIKN